MTLKLLEPLTLPTCTLANRIIMAPMTRSRADAAGVPGALTPLYYSQRASAGLIITEATNVSAMAKGYVRTPGIWTEAQIAGWRAVTDAVHAQGGRIFMQLFHTGRIALPEFLPDGAQPVAPSAITAQGKNYTDSGMKSFVMPRALAPEEIPGIVDEFRQATVNAFAAGCDGVELHAASGYLVQQFLSSGTNQRSDRYGGGLDNRARFALEVLEAMASVRGPAYVGVKFSPAMPFNDIQEGDAEAMYPHLMRALAGKGLAYVHVGRYTPTDWHALLRPLYDGIYFAGAGFTRDSGEALLAAGGANAIVYGALLLANPDLPERFRRNAALNTPDTQTYYTPGPAGYIDYPGLDAAAT